MFKRIYSAIAASDCRPFDVLGKEIDYALKPHDMLEGSSALIIWGGSDISPDFYGHPMSKKCYPYAGRRDTMEWNLLQEAITMKIAIIGVCRGAQMLCAAAGGYLIQDVHGHAGAGHLVDTIDGKQFRVNTIHHQMMAGLENTDHELVAWTTQEPPKFEGDKLYRGQPYTYKDDKEFIPPEGWKEPEFVYFPKIKGYAIQWHPEAMSPESAATQYILNYIREKEKFGFAEVTV